MAGALDETLQHTALFDLHGALGARMVPFAGYAMPVQYKEGILAEHAQVRRAAGLFDVSHMGQARLVGPDHATTARALEALVPSDILGLAPGAVRYTLLLDEEGGILDDLMVTRPASPAEDGRLLLVVNAACKEADFAHLDRRLPADIRLERMPERALLALQGPMAQGVMARLAPQAGALAFMTAGAGTLAGLPCQVSRTGYTGEDGFEIAIDAALAETAARALLAEPEVAPIGLGARDSLRLEAGLCLYGHDLDRATSPVEAGLAFTIARRRRQEGGFPGAARILAELAQGPARRRVGMVLEDQPPAREGTMIAAEGGRLIGTVTSGGFAPTLGKPVAMGYVRTADAGEGARVELLVRGRPRPARIVPLPFVPHRYHRQGMMRPS